MDQPCPHGLAMEADTIGNLETTRKDNGSTTLPTYGTMPTSRVVSHFPVHCSQWLARWRPSKSRQRDRVGSIALGVVRDDTITCLPA